VSNAAVHAAKSVTRTIPIVFTLVTDPVASGYVASLAQPGGNITGLTTISAEIIGRQLQLLKELVPQVSRVAVLQNLGNPGHHSW
jgi:putative ABC transport system substrate-binding protein